MQYVGLSSGVALLTVASNDNDDLLSFSVPSAELAFIQKLKLSIEQENKATGILLKSRKERNFFQEILDAERYIFLRYFSNPAPEASLLRKLKRRILDQYLFPRGE